MEDLNKIIADKVKKEVENLENNPVVLYNNPKYTVNGSSELLIEYAGTGGQTITLSDLPQNYKKIELVLGAVAYDSGCNRYYYPYLDTVSFYPQTSVKTTLYAHKASNYYVGNQFLRWQINCSKDSKEVTAYTHQTGGVYWQGIFVSAVYGYK